MTGSLAESYVRRCGEDELRRGRRDEEESGGLRERLRAFVMVGLLEADVARGILSGYARARAYRGFPSYHLEERPTTSGAGEDQRVCGCTGEVQVAGATVLPRLVVLGARRTRLAVTIRLAPPAGQPRSRHHPGYAGPPDLKLRDDAGRSVTAEFSDGGGDSVEWRGWYQVEPGLSPTTEWIEIDGTRLALRDAESGAGVTVENLIDDEASVEERATRYLEHCTEFAHSTHEPAALAAVADALATCGALTRDAPAVQRALEDTDSRPAHPTVFPHHARRRGGRTPDRNESLLIGVTTPPFDGVAIGVTELNSTRYGFRVEIEGYGSVEFGHDLAGIDTARLVFAASDDLGNRYRGSIGDFSHGSEGFSGGIEFEPSLDADATALDVVFSTERARAIVHVPLRRDGQS